MHTLTDLQVLALLCAAPVDEGASDGNGVRPGHVTTWERAGVERVFDELTRDSTAVLPAEHGRVFRVILARVFGLPARAPEDVEPIVMILAWESDRPADADLCSERVADLLNGARCPPGRLDARIEALCAEVLELRRVTATTIDDALAKLQADAGPPSTPAPRTATPGAFIPSLPLYKCAAPGCPGLPYMAGMKHPDNCGETT